MGEQFQVEALDDTELYECLQPFCEEFFCTPDDFDLISSDGSLLDMATPAYCFKNDIVTIKFKNDGASETSSQASLSRSSSQEEKVIRSLPRNINVKTSGKQKVKIYFTTFRQIGNHNKIFLNKESLSNRYYQEYVSPSTSDADGSDLDDCSVETQGTDSDEEECISNRKYKRQQSWPSTLCHVTNLQNEQSDGAGGVNQQVIYENVETVRSLLAGLIPDHIHREACLTRGFWDLPSHKYIQRTLSQLEKRYGEKDGRYIIWKHGRKRYAVSVTYQGGLKHFQIVWTESQLQVYGRNVRAADLHTLLNHLSYTPLYLSNMVDQVTLTSPIAAMIRRGQRRNTDSVIVNRSSRQKENNPYMDMCVFTEL